MLKHSAQWLLLLLPLLGSAQSLDSLLRAIQTMPDDSNRVLAYREAYLQYYDQERTEEMFEMSTKGLELSKKLGFERGVDLFLFYKATTLDMLGRGQESIQYFEEGLQLAKRRGDAPAVADYEVNLGGAFYALGNLDQALDHYLNAYQILKTRGQQKSLSRVLNNIGIIYRTQGKRERAESIYLESLSIKEALKDTLGMAASYQNLAALLSTTPRETETLQYLNAALAIYERAGKVNDAAGCYALLGQIHFNYGRFAAAKTALLKAKTFYDRQPSPQYASNVYRLLGSVAETEKNNPLAEQFLLQSAQIARQFGQDERLWDILNELSKIQEKLGKYSAAYGSLREASTIRDSVVEKSKIALMEELQTKFDVAQKDNEIKINQLNLQRRTRERNWLIGAAALLALLAGGVYWALRANQKIAAQEKALQQQRLQQLAQAHQLATLQAMLDGEEKERGRIAADLHDSLGGLMASVKAHVNARGADPSLLYKTNQLIDEAAGEIRRIAHNMMPRALAVAGLPGALQDLSAGLRQQGIDCQLELIGLNASLPAQKALMVYRIIQELANNVVKHAGADQLLIQVMEHDEVLTIIVEDNGKGFDLDAARQNKSLGLSNIESRVQYLHGEIDWDTAPGVGATVVIRVPLR